MLLQWKIQDMKLGTLRVTCLTVIFVKLDLRDFPAVCSPLDHSEYTSLSVWLDIQHVLLLHCHDLPSKQVHKRAEAGLLREVKIACN